MRGPFFPSFFFLTNRYYTYVSGRQIEMKSVRFGWFFSTFPPKRSTELVSLWKLETAADRLREKTVPFWWRINRFWSGWFIKNTKAKPTNWKPESTPHVLPQIEHQNNWADPPNRTIFCNPGQFYKSFSSVWFWIVKKFTSQFGFDLWGGKIEVNRTGIQLALFSSPAQLSVEASMDFWCPSPFIPYGVKLVG